MWACEDYPCLEDIQDLMSEQWEDALSGSIHEHQQGLVASVAVEFNGSLDQGSHPLAPFLFAFQ